MLKILESEKFYLKFVVQKIKCHLMHAENFGIGKDSF